MLYSDLHCNSRSSLDFELIIRCFTTHIIKTSCLRLFLHPTNFYPIVPKLELRYLLPIIYTTCRSPPPTFIHPDQSTSKGNIHFKMALSFYTFCKIEVSIRTSQIKKRRSLSFVGKSYRRFDQLKCECLFYFSSS